MISFAKAIIEKEEMQAVNRVLASGWLTMGEETAQFENEFAKFVGADYAIAINSCTAGLFLSLKALGIGKGDEVIVPSLTFVATANVVLHVGATPVFADIRDDDWTLDANAVEKARTKRTKAIIPVHYAARKAFIAYDLPVIEDSAHLIDKKCDSGNITAYSFYVTKNMTTGEGGMITTKDKELAEWFKKARLHGLSKDAWKRYGWKGKWHYDAEFPGYKYNTTDLNSALGRVQLRRLPGLNEKRNKLVSYYNTFLGLNNTGNHIYPILVENRDKFMQYMNEKEIQCSVHFLPVHLMSAYKGYKAKLPVTEYVGKHVVTLPLHPLLTKKDIVYIADCVRAYKKKNE